MGANAKKRREPAMSGASSSTASRQQKIQAAAPKRAGGPNRIVLGAVLAVVAIIAIVAGVIVSTRGGSGGAITSHALPPGVSTMGGGLQANNTVTLVKGAPTLDLYEDFQCPICHEFEKLFGAQIRSQASAGKVKLNYHVLNFLDSRSPNESSTRAALGAFCAADQGKFEAYHDQVYANQPQQEGAGWTDAQLKSYAQNVGLNTSTWQTCVKDKKYQKYLDAVQQQAAKGGVTGTPTIKLNGKIIDLQGLTPASLDKAIADATK